MSLLWRKDVHGEAWQAKQDKTENTVPWQAFCPGKCRAVYCGPKKEEKLANRGPGTEGRALPGWGAGRNGHGR